MTKSELVNRISAIYPYMSVKNIERVVSIIFDTISDHLARGGRTEIREFGSFSVRKRKEQMGKNPRTGEPVLVSAKWVPYFKAGKVLKDSVNEENLTAKK